MIYLVLNIISSTAIVILFKFFERLKISTFRAIVINYIVAATVGIVLNRSSISYTSIYNQTWFYLAVIIGILFIVMFNVIARTAQKNGIAVASVAGKMSVIIPISFSIVYYNEALGLQKVFGIILALSAVVLIIIPRRNMRFNLQYIYWPVLLFTGSGIVDSMVKFAQAEYLSDDVISIFSALLFAIAGVTGIITMLVKNDSLLQLANLKVLAGGTLLGICNFGSIYFLVLALNRSGMDSSIVFGINNVGVLLFSVCGGMIFFRERLSLINWTGFMLAIIAIIILSQI